MKCIVHVEQSCRVVVDAAKFTPQFMEEFKETFYRFDSIEDHIKHLGQLHLRGLANNHSFIEGYGQAAEMGIVFSDNQVSIVELQ